MGLLSLRATCVAQVTARLRQYCRGVLPPSEVGRLADLAARIAMQKLSGRLRAAARAEETSLPGLALSVIGGLFCGRGPSSALASALEDVLDADDVTLFLRFQTVVVRTATQEMFHRWSENDPLSARLWRALQRALRHDDRILAFPVERHEWAVLAGECDLRSGLAALGHDEIVRALANLADRRDSVAELIVAILAYAASRPDRRKAVRIETLFSALRETFTQTLADDLAAYPPIHWDDPDLSLAIERATDTVYDDLAARLRKYLAAGKLQPDMVDYFKQALTDILADCIDGGPAQSYYDYLRAHRSDLTKESYRTEFRAKFEYLAEAVHQGFLDAMREQLGGGKSAEDQPGT